MKNYFLPKNRSSSCCKFSGGISICFTFAYGDTALDCSSIIDDLISNSFLLYSSIQSCVINLSSVHILAFSLHSKQNFNCLVFFINSFIFLLLLQLKHFTITSLFTFFLLSEYFLVFSLHAKHVFIRLFIFINCSSLFICLQLEHFISIYNTFPYS